MDTSAVEPAARPVPSLLDDHRGWPVLGQIFEYAKDPVALMRRQWEAYGPVAPLNAPGLDAVMVLGPDAVGEVLLNRDKAFANGPAWGRIVGPFFDRGLMLLDGLEHRTHKRVMQEAFTRDRLLGYAELLGPAITAGTAGWASDPQFASYPRLKQLTLDIAAELFMGGAPDHGPEQMDRVNAAFVACVQAAGGLIRARVPGTRWGRAHRGRRVLEDFLRHYLPAKRAVATSDIFSVLCHVETPDGTRFSDDDVVNHMVFLMMAAHDTSTSTLTSMLRHLGQHPQWQDRCRAESVALDASVAGAASFEELHTLASLDLVMREALRLQAPVPLLVRTTVRDTVVAGVRIPADTEVMVCLQFSHLMEEYWSDPEVFDPERFTAERAEDTSHRYAWAPFGGGAHKCIGLYFAGMEVKAIMHQLLLSHTWTVPGDYVPPLDHHSLPYPTDGQPIGLTRLSDRSV